MGPEQGRAFMSVKDKKGNEIGILPNPPVFFKVIPTLVKAYTTAIVAKLYNARNTPPILDYRPRMQTDQNMVEASIITNLADGIGQKMGYGAQLRAMIDQMCRYGLMLAFPREEWYWEWQRTFGGPKNRVGEDTGKKQTIREGLRYIIPDPTRFYYDLKYPLTSLNTNSGTEFIGHWHVLSYGQILDNKEWWNRSHIFAGTNWFKYPGSKYFWQEVYPCKMDISWGQEPGEMKREDRASWYSTADRDKSIFVAEHFEKLVPRDWGLGDYDGPVWHRFTMAGDDTPIWIEPSAITPGIFMGYDYSENNDRTSSLSLEILPWQDWLGNILSQILLTAKQNLMKVIFYDKNQIDPDQIKEMRNIGEQMYRGMQFIPFDPLTNRIAQQNAQQAFFPVQLGTASINELIQVLPVFLSIMERVLQISAQMAGGAGPHQQGSKEIAQLGQSGQSRLDFIGAAIDEGIDAWETQLFDAAVNYADTDFVAQVDTDTPNLEHVIEEMGFTIRHKGKEKTMIAGSWKKLQLRDFARVGEGQTKETDRDAGQAIANVVAAVAAQKDLHEKIGATNLLQLLEYAARLMGAPKALSSGRPRRRKRKAWTRAPRKPSKPRSRALCRRLTRRLPNRLPRKCSKHRAKSPKCSSSSSSSKSWRSWHSSLWTSRISRPKKARPKNRLPSRKPRPRKPERTPHSKPRNSAKTSSPRPGFNGRTPPPPPNSNFARPRKPARRPNTKPGLPVVTSRPPPRWPARMPRLRPRLTQPKR